MDMDKQEEQKARASAWFKTLRDEICARFEQIEDDAVNTPMGENKAGRFDRKKWDREDSRGGQGGGGEMSVMRGGRVFEKVGVNISTVEGHFPDDFASKIPGAAENDAKFWASGVSLVAHFRSPHVPPFHFNTRHIITNKGWFGGGGDMNPIFEVEEDTQAFHAAWKEVCDKHDPSYYPKFSKWADEYFFIKHRNEPRGIGGGVYDYLDSGDWDADFAFTQDIGRCFRDIVPELIRKNMEKSWTDAEREAQLIKRGRYVEFNLVYDRGTVFGLQTGGNTEAILMSMPPEAKWP